MSGRTETKKSNGILQLVPFFFLKKFYFIILKICVVFYWFQREEDWER